MPSAEPNTDLNQSTARLTLWVHAFLLLGLVTAALICAVFRLDAEFLIRPLCVSLLLLYLWALWSWHTVMHTLFDPYILFFTAALLFNGGQALLEIFDLNPSGILDGAFSAEMIAQTLLLVVLGLAFVHLGGLASVALTQRNSSQAPPQANPARVPLAAVRSVGWLLLAISIVPTALRLRDAVSVVLSTGYGGLFQQAASTSFDAAPQVLAAFLLPAALFLLAGSGSQRIEVIVSAVLILGYSVTEFFLGSRSVAAMPLIAYAWVYHRTVRRLPTILLVASGAVVLFILFPLVQVVRTVPGGERLDLATLGDAFLSIQNPVIATLNEMGASMLTVTFTLELVPAVRGFDFGIGYLYALLTMMPNLFWQVHPTIAHGLAGRWLVETVAPLTAELGGGYGYSFIAEAYLNFGWVGAPLCLGLIGWLYGKLVWWGQTNDDHAKIAMVASFLTFSLIYARSESATIVRPLLWYALLPFLLVQVINRVSRKASAMSAGTERV